MILQSKHDQIILNCFMAERYVRRVLVEEDGLRDASHIKSTSLSVLLKFNIYTPVLLIVSKWAKNWDALVCVPSSGEAHGYP